MKNKTVNKWRFDGTKLVRIPEEEQPIRLIPSDISPAELKIKDYPKHWFWSKPKIEKNNKEEIR